MKEIMQQTLAAPIAYSGIGLHSGKEVAMKLLPGKENTGIVFVRTDLSGHPEIQALAENVSSTVKATTVSENGTEVFTVEHLMAAFSMMGIDNCRIEMSAPEPPVTDGSAAVFCELILQAGRIRYMLLTGLFLFMKMINISRFNRMMVTGFLLYLLTRILL